MAGNCLSFAQGQTGLLTTLFVTTVGQPIDVPDAMVTIIGVGGNTVVAATPMTQIMTGLYFYDWTVPNSLPVGAYTVQYTGTILGIPTAATDSVNVLPAGTPAGMIMDQGTQALITALTIYLGCAQNIPVYHEKLRADPTRQVFSSVFPRWNMTNYAVFLNNEQVGTGYAVDLNNGAITFDAPLLPSDVVDATYNFQFFTQQDLLRFLTDALGQVNLETPGTSFMLTNLSDPYVSVVLMGAAKNAIRKLLFCLNFQEAQKIFGGPQGAKDAMSNLNTLKENYEKEFTADKKQIKIAVYPKIHIISQPEYTLPGGRSRWFRYLFSSALG